MKEYFSTLIEGFKTQPISAWAAVAGLIVLGTILLFVRGQKFTPRMLAVGAISISIAFVLSFIKLYSTPYGGSVTLASMLPIVAFAWAFGAPAGIVAGIAYGLLQIIQGAYIIHPVQFLFDYILPFAFLGFAGFFKNKNLVAAIIVACFLRFLSHFLSGIIFWGDYAAEGQPVWLYSLIYNGSYMLPETIICIVIVLIPAMRKVIDRLNNDGVKS